MYHCFIVTSDDTIKAECESIISQVGEIQVNHVRTVETIEWNNRFVNCLFILITEINEAVLPLITKIQKNIPDLSIIFYNHSLVLSNLQAVSDSSMFNLIVGENRKVILNQVVRNLKQNYWRKIPFEKFGITYEALSPRLKKALTFVESSNISECNINSIAHHISISPGYFSQEFKRETGQSFRSFMQRLLNYYEEVIFQKINLSTKNISKLLGYSELSSFSRSFKNRKGVSPTEYKKLVHI